MIPLTIIASAGLAAGGKGTADRIIDRYELTGGGAEAVSDIFAPASGTSTSLGVLGSLFLISRPDFSAPCNGGSSRPGSSAR